MNPHKQNTGIGNYQIHKMLTKRLSILEPLSDGQWHRTMELKEKTKLSSRTLHKHLNYMTNVRIIEKKTDVESGKYPIPVLYKATSELTIYMKSVILRNEIIEGLEPMLNETKDPLFVLDIIHLISQTHFIELLKQIQQNKNITNKEIYFFEESFLWTSYQQYTSKLIEESHKIINNINITQSLIEQAKRNIEVYQKTLKKYEEIQQQKNP